jgi:hypothetical protein
MQRFVKTIYCFTIYIHINIHIFVYIGKDRIRGTKIIFDYNEVNQSDNKDSVLNNVKLENSSISKIISDLIIKK